MSFNPFIREIEPCDSFDETWDLAQQALKTPLVKKVKFTFWCVPITVTKNSKKGEISSLAWTKSPVNPNNVGGERYFDGDEKYSEQFNQGGYYVG